MHTETISLSQITKVEGSAGLDVRIEDGKAVEARFKITEFKRFYTRAMKGKPVMAVPQLLSRICGTCSNAHLLCAIECAEDALDIKSSAQTDILRDLLMYGLMICDHALHLYLFSMPDMYGKDAFLEFDENKPEEHQILHDAFELKAAGNFLSIIVGGRSVHAPFPTIGGFIHFPNEAEISEAIDKLEKARAAALYCINIYQKDSRTLDRQASYLGLKSDKFNFLRGQICSSDGECILERNFRKHLDRIVKSYTHATCYLYNGKPFMVGSLARLNIAKETLNKETQKGAAQALALFPSTNIYRNNLAQAIEILHSIDESIKILKEVKIKPEPLIKKSPKKGEGIGVIEAPRGTLYHKMSIDDKGIVTGGDIVVPTGQNQCNIEADVVRLVSDLLPNTPKEKIELEIEKLIRAYDPCMSCASHFLKVKWLE